MCLCTVHHALAHTSSCPVIINIVGATHDGVRDSTQHINSACSVNGIDGSCQTCTESAVLLHHAATASCLLTDHVGMHNPAKLLSNTVQLSLLRVRLTQSSGIPVFRPSWQNCSTPRCLLLGNWVNCPFTHTTEDRSTSCHDVHVRRAIDGKANECSGLQHAGHGCQALQHHNTV